MTSPSDLESANLKPQVEHNFIKLFYFKWDDNIFKENPADFKLATETLFPEVINKNTSEK